MSWLRRAVTAGMEGLSELRQDPRKKRRHSWKDWPPTEKVIAVRDGYKEKIWRETDVARIRNLLTEFFNAEQAAWAADKKLPWNPAATKAFLRDVGRVKDPAMALRVIRN